MILRIGNKVDVIDKFMQESFHANIHELLETADWIIVSWVQNNRSRFGLCQVYPVHTKVYNKKLNKLENDGLSLQFRCMEYGDSPDEVINNRNEWFKSQTQVLRRSGHGN